MHWLFLLFQKLVFGNLRLCLGRFRYFLAFHTHRERLILFCFFFLCCCVIHNLLNNTLKCFISCPSSGNNWADFFMFTGKIQIQRISNFRTTTVTCSASAVENRTAVPAVCRFSNSIRTKIQSGLIRAAFRYCSCYRGSNLLVIIDPGSLESSLRLPCFSK